MAMVDRDKIKSILMLCNAAKQNLTMVSTITWMRDQHCSEGFNRLKVTIWTLLTLRTPVEMLIMTNSNEIGIINAYQEYKNKLPRVHLQKLQKSRLFWVIIHKAHTGKILNVAPSTACQVTQQTSVPRIKELSLTKTSITSSTSWTASRLIIHRVGFENVWLITILDTKTIIWMSKVVSYKSSELPLLENYRGKTSLSLVYKIADSSLASWIQSCSAWLQLQTLHQP